MFSHQRLKIGEKSTMRMAGVDKIETNKQVKYEVNKISKVEAELKRKKKRRDTQLTNERKRGRSRSLFRYGG